MALGIHIYKIGQQCTLQKKLLLPGDNFHSTLYFINYSFSFSICKRIPFAFMFSFCNHVAPGPVMMSNNGQAVTNTTGSVTSLLGVGDFSWAVNSSGHFFSKWANSSGHFQKMNFCGHFSRILIAHIKFVLYNRNSKWVCRCKCFEIC